MMTTGPDRTRSAASRSQLPWPVILAGLAAIGLVVSGPLDPGDRRCHREAETAVTVRNIVKWPVLMASAA
jgi:hypothetical protein